MTNHLNKNITPYQDINDVLQTIANGIDGILAQNLIGLYLFGSLTYGDFNPNRSDIDLIAITNLSLDDYILALLEQLHKQIGVDYPKWKERLECSYTPMDLFNCILPPKEPRPYFGGGIFYAAAPYGNEWIINNYLLYNHGVSLIGRDIKQLINPIHIIEVQKACIRDLFQEWIPKITDITWLENSHYQSYLILNLCRILYTVLCGVAGSKKISAEWVKNKFGSSWRNLIETAESWKYGEKMYLRNDTIRFIEFTIQEIKRTKLYQQIYPR